MIRPTFLLSLLFLVLNIPAAAQNSSVAAFFRQAVRGADAYYAPRRQPALKDVAQARRDVWQQWCTALQTADQPLRPLSPLSPDARGTWHVPDSLEPNAELNYYYGTKGATPRKGYPLFIYLHGSGPREYEWATGLTLATRFADGPSAYFIPQIPQEGAWYRWYQRSKQWVVERLLRRALADSTIDADRIYLFGISEGGYGSQRLASFYADYLAAAGPMAGGEPLRNAPAENLRNTPFSLRTGAEDRGFYRNYLTALTHRALDSLGCLSAGAYLHWVRLEAGRGHAIDYGQTPTWLMQWRRVPLPRVVSWEDFEMDGRHRRGFANLQILERPAEAERTRYDERISDNTITISVRAVDYAPLEVDPHYGIELQSARTYRPVRSGRFVVYLSDELIDPTRPVRVVVNGQVFRDARLVPTAKALVNSTACFGDPRRLFPYAVEVDLNAD